MQARAGRVWGQSCEPKCRGVGVGGGYFADVSETHPQAERKKLYTRVLEASSNILHPKTLAGGPLCTSNLKSYWRHMWRIFLKEIKCKFAKIREAS